MPRLRVTHGGRETVVDLPPEGLRVGSGPGNGILVMDADVGREHLEIRPGPKGWRLVDLESASGTRVNGILVNQHVLRDGDLVALGTATLRYEEAGGTAAAVVAAPLPGVAAAPAPAPVAVAGAPATAAPPAARPAAAAPGNAATAAAMAARSRGGGVARRRAPRADGAGWEAMVLFAILGVLGIAVVVFVLRGGAGRSHPNGALLERVKELNEQHRYAEALALEARVTTDENYFLPFLREQLDLARAGVEGERLAALEKEATRFLEWEVRKFQQDHRRDTAGLIRRYDEFLERFRGTSQWHVIADRRLKLAGAPSPAAVGGAAAAPADGATAPTRSSGTGNAAALLKAASEEADRLAADDRYGDAMAVYDRFLENSLPSLAESTAEVFRSEITKRREKVRKAAYAAFERVEQRAFTLSETGKYEEALTLYRRVAETFGVDEIEDQAKREIDRIRGLRR